MAETFNDKLKAETIKKFFGTIHTVITRKELEVMALSTLIAMNLNENFNEDKKPCREEDIAHIIWQTSVQTEADEDLIDVIENTPTQGKG
jgi:hypothetical protein